MRLSILLFVVIGWNSAFSQYNSETIKQYIDYWWQTAVEEMDEYGIPASISLAQGILESGAGTSRLATQGNNHFGIKCHSGWNGKRIYEDDDAAQECFRKYRNADDSWRDHSEFLRNRSRYSSLFFLNKDDYVAWAKGLKRAGYATNPKYANILIKLIEDHDLARYDRMGREEILASTGKRPKREEINEEARATKTMEVFWFNRIKTVYAQPGDNPTTISKRYKIRRNLVMRYNDLGYGEALEPGQKVYLQPKRKKSKQRFHLVQDGETLADISQLHGVKLDALAVRNHVGPTFIPAPGERIYLRGKRDYAPKVYNPASAPAATPKSAEAAKREENLTIAKGKKVAQQKTAVAQKEDPSTLALPGSSTKPASPETVFYTVEAGDTLYSLSKAFKHSVDQIKAWNGLTSNNISIGQQLIVGMK